MLFRSCVAVPLVLLLANSSFAFEVHATVRKVDIENNRLIVVGGGGSEHTVKVPADAKFLDEKGGELAEGLKNKELKEGTAVTLNVVPEGNSGPVLKKLQLGRQPINGNPASNPGGNQPPAITGKSSVGFRPLNEMTADDKYKGQDGGLYGGGKNVPPEAHRAAAKSETAKIVPLDAEGKPSSDGKIVLISISMSNATQEFSKFKQLADSDAEKSSKLTIVDCAQGGQAMAQWVSPTANAWSVTKQRLQAANVTPQQVQVAWVKLANVRPTGELADHTGKLQKDTAAVVQNAKAMFPNLRIVYLGSRIYAGYATTPLNPEPYAYEGAFAVRGMIQDQIKGNSELNYDAERGSVKASLLLWGPYFWADGITPRKEDGLTYERSDLAGDGTHPSEAGRTKVAQQILKFFKTDADAQTWFAKK